MGTANIVANVLPLIPGLEVTCDCGAVFYAAMLLWLTGILVLRSAGRSEEAAAPNAATVVGKAA